MARCVAVNVGANTNQPGFRGPIYADGSFEFVPIPETEPTAVTVPTYADLPVSIEIPEELRDVPVHLDPEFAEYAAGDRYTYGDPYGVKAQPLRSLERGDSVCFYATLSTHSGSHAREWIADDWGAYLIGRFELARDPIHGDDYASLPADVKERFATNAHVKRETFDAAVLLEGTQSGSRLYESAVPLSGEVGTAANRLVTEYSADSGRGPWWRRPLRFDKAGTARLRTLESASDDEKAALHIVD